MKNKISSILEENLFLSDVEFEKIKQELNDFSVNSTDNFGNSALHHAVANHNKLWLTYFIKNGANLSLQNIDGNTPLHIAAIFNYKEIFEILIKENKEISLLPNNKGLTPYCIAKDNGCTEILLLKEINHTEKKNVVHIPELHLTA